MSTQDHGRVGQSLALSQEDARTVRPMPPNNNLTNEQEVNEHKSCTREKARSAYDRTLRGGGHRANAQVLVVQEDHGGEF